MKKSNKKGFTLVELVVVIAIIGVLAAILVPSMMGYVKKSRLKTANSNAKTAYNSVATFVADEETKGSPITWTGVTVKVNCVDGSVTAGSTTTGISSAQKSELGTVVKNCLSDNGKEAGRCLVSGTTINGNTNAFYVQWRKTDTDDMIGQYPNPVEKVDSPATWGTFKS